MFQALRIALLFGALSLPGWALAACGVTSDPTVCTGTNPGTSCDPGGQPACCVSVGCEGGSDGCRYVDDCPAPTVCTTYSCVSGPTCTGFAQPCQPPPNQCLTCTGATCSDASGWTYGVRTNQGCDDGNPCTFSDRCSADAGCAGIPYSCSPTDCQLSSVCDGSGGCVVTNKAFGTACGVGCNSGTCQGGFCSPNQGNCPSTSECATSYCDPTTGTCQSTPMSGPICDGGTCNNGLCVQGQPGADAGHDAGPGIDGGGGGPDGGDPRPDGGEPRPDGGGEPTAAEVNGCSCGGANAVVLFAFAIVALARLRRADESRGG